MRRGEDLWVVCVGDCFGVKVPRRVQSPHGQINSSSDCGSQQTVLAQITSMSLFRAEIAQGLMTVKKHKHRLVSLCISMDKGRERQQTTEITSEMKYLHETTTEQSSLSAFWYLNITTSHCISCFPLPLPPSPHVRQHEESLLFKG